jgi:hypothetical protein
MRRWTTILAALAMLTLPSMAAAQGTGYYEWSVSASNSTPDANTGPDGTGGVNTVYLWFVAGCNTLPGFPGMASADIGLYGVDTWSVIAFNVMNGFLNAGNATKLLLAVGGCPTGPVVAGEILAIGVAGGIRLGIGTVSPPTSGTVDCTPDPLLWSWPQYVRYRGFKTDGSSATLQDHGNGCTADPVDPSSWGTIKSLYRN